MVVLGPKPKKIRQTVHRSDTGPVFRKKEGDRDYPNNDSCSRNDLRRPLNNNPRYLAEDTYWQRPAIFIRVISRYLCQALNNVADDYGVPPGIKWAGGGIQRNNRFLTPSLCRRAPLRLGR